MAGYVVGRLLGKIRSLIRAEKGAVDPTAKNLLTRIKDNGGLCDATQLVAEYVCRLESRMRAIMHGHASVHSVNSILPCLEEALISAIDFEPGDNKHPDGIWSLHKHRVQRLITHKYTKLRIYSLVNDWNAENSGIGIRQRLCHSITQAHV
jgi:hypothetical protein